MLLHIQKRRGKNRQYLVFKNHGKTRTIVMMVKMMKMIGIKLMILYFVCFIFKLWKYKNNILQTIHYTDTYKFDVDTCISNLVYMTSAQSQQIWKTSIFKNNWSKKTTGPKQDSQIQLRLLTEHFHHLHHHHYRPGFSVIFENQILSVFSPSFLYM
jgi:hypothetical protein